MKNSILILCLCSFLFSIEDSSTIPVEIKFSPLVNWGTNSVGLLHFWCNYHNTGDKTIKYLKVGILMSLHGKILLKVIR